LGSGRSGGAGLAVRAAVEREEGVGDGGEECARGEGGPDAAAGGGASVDLEPAGFAVKDTRAEVEGGGEAAADESNGGGLDHGADLRPGEGAVVEAEAEVGGDVARDVLDAEFALVGERGGLGEFGLGEGGRGEESESRGEGTGLHESPPDLHASDGVDWVFSRSRADWEGCAEWRGCR
jgi:hypothetical protein